MPNILDEAPYPWHKKEAQQLHLNLCRIYASAGKALNIAEQAGIEIYEINAEQMPYLVWAEILRYAAIHGLLRPLVTQVDEKLSATSPYSKFMQDLLNDELPAVDAEPIGSNGAPKFIEATDEITEHEALLFKDDLTLQIGKLPALITTLQEMVRVAPAVCHLIVTVDGGIQHGTGFRIGADMLLTNWHVLHYEKTGKRASAVTAEFLYEDDGAGSLINSARIPCDVTSIATDQADDWAVIRVSKPLDENWPVIKLSEAVAPQEAMEAYIIQHPGGESKRVGFVRNQVSDFTPRVVHYLTDTQGGSSGSPVFDGNGKLFGLHHAGGRPQELTGKPPLMKNEGICILKVIEGLKKQEIEFE